MAAIDLQFVDVWSNYWRHGIECRKPTRPVSYVYTPERMATLPFCDDDPTFWITINNAKGRFEFPRD